MLDLCAITDPKSEAPVWGNHRKYYRRCRHRDIFMSVEGDQPVDSLFFDDPELTLICRADLLTSDPVPKVAAHLGRLYRDHGDEFVCSLRGTFAIILYDHNHRTLKAWSDHFGA